MMNICCVMGLIGVLTALATNAHGQASAGRQSNPQTPVWHVVVDPEIQLFRSFRAALQAAGAPILVDGLGFDITRSGAKTATMAEKQELSAQWEQEIVDELEAEGLAVIDDDRLERETGLTLERMRRMMIDGQPFGNRDYAEARAGKELFFLLDEHPRPCRGGQGGLGALVMAYYPPEGVQSDYGNVAFMILGVGDCGSQNPAARRYVAKLKEKIGAAFPSSVDQD